MTVPLASGRSIPMRHLIISFAGLVLAAAVVVSVPAAGAPPGRMLDATFHHLGNDVVKNWPEAPEQPAGFKLQVKFQAEANTRELTLGITQRDVDDAWSLLLNGKEIAKLQRRKERQLIYYPVPPGSLITGENTLEISIKKQSDDITVGGFTLLPGTLAEVLKLQPITVTVLDKTTGRSVPARLTITDAQKVPQEIYDAATPQTAVRTGVLYVSGDANSLSLPPGDYQCFASRGTEWSQDRLAFTVAEGRPATLRLQLVREVDTTGFVAADTHIHTVTFSGHGDATIEERMVTLAAEGVELAIATDHNHQTDYTPYQARLKLSEHFTSVTGNEVTTKNGHFNSFPLPAAGALPDHNESDWVKLVNDIRAKGARVVILNHPHWPEIARSPFGKFGLNRASGERATGGPFQFDAMELVNSCTDKPDPLYILHDWFALLNHGERITAVGSSDSHTVLDPVGQGRTYVRSRTDDPARINVDEACDAFLAGDTSISLGIFADVKVNGSFHMGQTAGVKGRPVTVELRVASASWITPEKATVYLNSLPVAEQEVPRAGSGLPTNARLKFTLPQPSADAHLVCVVTGKGIDAPGWHTQQGYSFAATNPVYLDADGDGRYASPRETATVRLAAAGTHAQARWEAILKSDDAIAVQMAAQVRAQLAGPEREALDARIKEVGGKRPIFAEFLRYVPSPRQ